MQALAYRLPVIVTNVGNMAEFVEEGANGSILFERKKEMLAEKISFLISNDSERKRYGDNSYDLFKNRFVASRMTDETVEVFKKILDSQT